MFKLQEKWISMMTIFPFFLHIKQAIQSCYDKLNTKSFNKKRTTMIRLSLCTHCDRTYILPTRDNKVLEVRVAKLNVLNSAAKVQKIQHLTSICLGIGISKLKKHPPCKTCWLHKYVFTGLANLYKNPN